MPLLHEDWETVLDALPDPVILLGPDRSIRRANPAWNQLRLDPAAPGPWDGVFAGKVIHCEAPISDGTYEVRAHPLKDGGAVVILRDLTEHRLSAVGGLVGGVAHEMNNPLSSVLGFSELASNTAGVPPEAQEYLVIVLEEARRAVKILRNLLTFARHPKPARSSAQVNEIVRRVTDLMAYEFRVNKVKVVTDFDPNVPPAMIDPHRIQAVVFNLITNAVQSMTPSGTLTVTTKYLGARVRISIADTGAGIPADLLPRIFEPFFTTQARGKGIGLGLCASFNIIREHHGTITVKSTPGKGTQFDVELPLQPSVALPDPGTADGALRPLRILVVDDEPAIVQLLTNLLANPHTVFGAPDGQAAIDFLGRERVDLVITDMKMPRLGGREVYQFVQRERPELAGRVLFMSGDHMSEQTGDFLRQGSLTLLEKPFTARQVLEAVAAMMKK